MRLGPKRALARFVHSQSSPAANVISARYSVQTAPLSTNGERVGDYHHKFEGGKADTAVVMPPQAHRELKVKQNKTKPVVRSIGQPVANMALGHCRLCLVRGERPTIGSNNAAAAVHSDDGDDSDQGG